MTIYFLYKKLYKETIKDNLIFQLLLLVLANYIVTEFLYSALPLEEVYNKASIILSLFDDISAKQLIIVTSPILIWNITWNNLVSIKHLYIKYFVLFVMIVWVWKVATLDFNLYFNQAYNLDRVILIVLSIMTFYFPIALIYCVFFSTSFINQISYPRFAGSFPGQYIDSTPLIEILVVFICFMFLKRVYKNYSIISFFIVVLCLHGANYFVPGLAKILISENYIDWVFVNDLSNLMAAQYYQGWLYNLISFENFRELLKIVNIFSIPLQIGVFITQILAFFVFFDKKYTLFLFATFEILHLGVFLTSGIFFWKWILLNLSIILIINRLDNKEISNIFNIKILLVTMVIIIFGYKIFNPAWLGWYDSPLNNTFKIYATNIKGEKYIIDQNLLAPYDILFAQRNFTFLLNEKLRSSWGASDTNTMLGLKKLSANKNEIYAFEKKHSINRYDKYKVKQFSFFLKLYFQHWNERINKKLVWNLFSPPKHIYTSLTWDKNTKLDAKIKHVDVVYYKTFYDHDRNEIIVIEEKNVLTIQM